jgi:predicted DNA repair protein MutK
LTLAPNYINMASGFFAIFDDIAALMDDVAVAAKVATRKTVGILGDDLAVNAEKATGYYCSYRFTAKCIFPGCY